MSPLTFALLSAFIWGIFLIALLFLSDIRSWKDIEELIKELRGVDIIWNGKYVVKSGKTFDKKSFINLLDTYGDKEVISWVKGEKNPPPEVKVIFSYKNFLYYFLLIIAGVIGLYLLGALLSPIGRAVVLILEVVACPILIKNLKEE